MRLIMEGCSHTSETSGSGSGSVRIDDNDPRIVAITSP